LTGGGDLDHRAQRLVDRVAELAALTSRPGGCTRLPFSAELDQALDRVRSWLEPLGLRCETDAAGNFSAVLPGADAGGPRLVAGSHLDTVVDGGAWDGTLGVLVAADCVERLAAGETPPCDVEILVFADEERGCFGSRALAAERDPGTLGAFLEVHIEQGPILERLGRPLGVVSAIAGNTRAELRFDGAAGHAGTVPMADRHDALAAAAAWTVAVEQRASAEPELVATVGDLSAAPGQANVIAGSARATLDVRGPDDARRRGLVDLLREDADREAARRGVAVDWTETFDRPAAPMDPGLTEDVRRALARLGPEPPVLVSGAGHDAAVMASLCPTALLFVRCRGGVSHHPDEHVAAGDVRGALEAADLVLDEWLGRWPPASVNMP
jgi:allantoate deiminase